MKTTKLILIATIFTIGMMGMTTNVEAKGAYGNKAIYISLEDAVTNPALVEAMYYQLNVSILGLIDGDYTVTIFFDGIVVYITGSESDWFMFFHLRKLINTHEH